MRRRSLWFVAGITIASTSVAIVGIQWRAAGAEDAEARARALLDASLAEAPELDDIEATEAMAALDEAIELGADGLAGLRAYAEALTYLHAGDLIFAEGSLTEARHQDGWSPDLRVLAAAIARSKQEHHQAEIHANEALGADPEHPRALLMHADLALDEHDSRGALVALGRLVELAPRLAGLHNRRGLALEMADERDAARDAFERAIELSPDLPEPHINLGRIARADGDLARARTAFERATRLAADADAWLGLALCALDEDDLDVATRGFQRAMELAPHDVSGRIGLADVALRRGMPDDALDHYRAALREAPHHAAVWVKLGNLLVAQRDLNGAEEAFERAIRNGPHLAAAHNGMGATLMQLGRDAEAERALERAAELDPADPHPMMNLALMRERAGRADAARDAWREALRRDPESIVARSHL